MKTHSTLLTFALLALAVTAHSTPLQIDAPSTVTVSGRLMSPSHGWNFTLTRAGSITVKDGTGNIVAEKIWNDFNAANPDTYAARDTSVTTATVSKILSFSLSLEPGSYDVAALGSYSQASSGYLWIDVTTDVTPNTPAEVWTAFDELIRDWYDLTEWSPATDTVSAGQNFMQSKTQAQDWRKGERSNTGTERNVTPYTVTQQITQTANGTKPKATPVISWSAPASIVYGTRLTSTQLNATATVDGVAVAGNFNYSPGEGTTLNAGENQCLEVTFTPTESDKFDGATATQTLTVNKASTTLTITSPTNPSTLPIDSAAAITTTLRRDHDHAALSTANVTYSIASTTGTAAATLSLNTVTMMQGAGNDTVTVTAQFPGNANHLAASSSITFRVPVPGSITFSSTQPLVSPISLPSAFLHSEHGATTSALEIKLTNPGELAVDIAALSVTPDLGEIGSFSLVDENNRTNSPGVLAAGQTRSFKIVFRPSRYDLNRDAMRIAWRCRPNLTTVSSGEVNWILEGRGLAPRMATIPFGSTPDHNNPRDFADRWPALRSQ